MTFNLRRTVFITTVSILLIIGGAGFWYLGASLHQSQPTFSAYYSAMTVTGFDLAGNARGHNSIYRVDGLTGTPVKIFDDPNEVTYSDQVVLSPTQLTLTDFSQKKDTNLIVPATIGSVTTIDKHGQVIAVRATDQQVSTTNTFVETKQSPDGTYIVTTDLVCSVQVSDGPCPMIFTMRIYNTQTLTTTTLNQKNFGVGNIGALKVKVLDFLSDSIALVQINSQQELYLQMLETVDLSTGKVTELQRNFTSPTGDVEATYAFQWLESNNQSAIMLKRNMATEDASLRYVRFDISSKKFSDISPALQRYPDVLDHNLAGYYYQDNGVWYHDFAAHTDRQITISGQVEGFNPSLRYIPVTVFSTNNGLGPKKLVIQDLRTNKARTLFDQIVGTMREPADSAVPEANQVKVGSTIYQFLGIEQ